MCIIRKLFILTLSVVFIFSISTMAMAAEIEDNSIEGMDAYFSLSSDGTIDFDTSAALEAGYSSTAVATVLERINYLNSLVLTGEAFINENYGAVVGYSRARSANGGTYLVQNWDGSTDVFLSDYDAYYMKQAFDYVQRGLDPSPIIEYIDDSAKPYVYLACATGMIQCEIYKNQISIAQADVAAAPADEEWRVVMHVFYIEGTQNLAFYASESVL